jgi:hypothetical protein
MHAESLEAYQPTDAKATMTAANISLLNKRMSGREKRIREVSA